MNRDDRPGELPRAALAAGIAYGLLAGEGWHAMVAAPLWQLLAAPDPQQADFVRGMLVSQLVKIVLPLAVLAGLATAHRLWRAWPVLLTAAVSSAALTALLWYVLTAVAAGM